MPTAKKVIKKTPVKKVVKKAAVKKTAPKKVVLKAEVKIAAPKEAKVTGLSVSIFDAKGAKAGTMSLPKEIFGAKINKSLMAQAVRVYLANQRQGNASTKSRGEVNLTTAKWYKQKGTGRARHGAQSAPIFVGGGVAFGPKPHDFSMSFSKKMKRAALFSALSAKLTDGEIKVVTGFEKIEPKTKVMFKSIEKINGVNKKRKLLFVTVDSDNSVNRAGRNIEGLNMLSANKLNAYSVLDNRGILIMKSAIEVMEKVFLKEKDE